MKSLILLQNETYVEDAQKDFKNLKKTKFLLVKFNKRLNKKESKLSKYLYKIAQRYDMQAQRNIELDQEINDLTIENKLIKFRLENKRNYKCTKQKSDTSTVLDYSFGSFSFTDSDGSSFSDDETESLFIRESDTSSRSLAINCGVHYDSNSQLRITKK